MVLIEKTWLWYKMEDENNWNFAFGADRLIN